MVATPFAWDVLAAGNPPIAGLLSGSASSHKVTRNQTPIRRLGGENQWRDSVYSRVTRPLGVTGHRTPIFPTHLDPRPRDLTYRPEERACCVHRKWGRSSRTIPIVLYSERKVNNRKREFWLSPGMTCEEAEHNTNLTKRQQAPAHLIGHRWNPAPDTFTICVPQCSRKPAGPSTRLPIALKRLQPLNRAVLREALS